jgi:hypothetical protein
MEDKIIFNNSENVEDEAEIVGDVDETTSDHSLEEEELEDLPEKFIRGELDVKEQMDRTDAHIIDASIGGNLSDEWPDGVEH